MITLYVAGRKFEGLPDPSPFVCKALVLLKMSGLPFQTKPADFGKAPKGKIPYIEDDGRLIGDSTLIRWHLEARHHADFDKGLSDADKATAWAFEKMCEDHLYWTVVESRWMDDANFEKGPKTFFAGVPAPIRPFVLAMVKRKVKKTLYAQGTGRHSKSEIERLGIRDIDALAAFLGDKPCLMGDAPCGADASVWSMIAGAMTPLFETPIRTAAEKHSNLVAYRDRGLKQWFPEVDAGSEGTAA